MAPLDAQYRRGYQLAYLLVGEEAGATDALMATIRRELHGDAEFWTELALAALGQAANLSPDRFFLRTLAKPEGLAVQVNRLPESERTALLLDASGAFTLDQITSLLRLPKGAAEALLARTWRSVDLERTSLWAAMLETVPPLEPALERRVEALLAGDESVLLPLSGRAPRWRRIWPAAFAFLAVFGALLALRWWPKEAEVVLTDRVNFIEVPSPPSSVDLTPYQESAVIGLTTYQGRSIQVSADGLERVAEMVLQWLGEAKVVGENPTATPNTERLSLRLRFADETLDLWLSAQDSCMTRVRSCPITVGGVGKTPLWVEQADLDRWMAGSGWNMAIRPDHFSLVPSNGPRRLRQNEVTILPAVTIPDGSVVELPGKVDVVVLHQDANGRWRTALKPAWSLFIHPSGDPMRGEMLVIDDETGAVLHRTAVQFVHE